MQVINLGGRTAIPGLVDNHNHFILLGLRPGHDTRLETAASIADVQAAIRARTKTVKRGDWITAMGGWTPGQFKENRLPTLTELDAAAQIIRCLSSIPSRARRLPTRRGRPS
jgi:predicted amidohydrolase YtcJ